MAWKCSCSHWSARGGASGLLLSLFTLVACADSSPPINWTPAVFWYAPKAATNRINFNVADVIPATNQIPEIAYTSIVETIGGRTVAFSCQQSNVADIGNGMSETLSYNQFLVAVGRAFSEHRPLSISPDHIWLLICQGFARHVHQNSERLRPTLAGYQGKKTIVIDNRHGEMSWEQVIHAVAAETGRQVNSNIHHTLCIEFSESQPTAKTSFEIAFADAMNPYSTLVIFGTCGFPRITLEGSPDDWRRVRDHARMLRQYDLAWWIAGMEPIFEQFIATAEGHPDPVFWNSMYKSSEYYSAQIVNGWVTKFFPYVKEGKSNKDFVRNKMDGSQELFLMGFPRGIIRCPFAYVFRRVTLPMDMVAGFIGIAQDAETGTLRPLINWAIVDASQERTLTPDERKAVAEMRATLERRNAQ